MPSHRSAESPAVRVVVPAPPAPREPHLFPVVATIAPVVVSLAMWAATRSPFALMFAAFGPVMAIAGYVDAGLGGRRRYRTASRSFATAMRDAEDDVARAHDDERRRRWTEHPAPSSIVEAGRTDVRWRMAADAASRVSIGAGAAPSALVIDGGGPPDAKVSHDSERLRRAASIVDDVPVLIDTRRGVGIVGPLAIGRAVARGLLVQLAHASAPDVLEVSALPDTGWESFIDLPHAVRRPGASSTAASTVSVEERSANAGGSVTAADLRIVIAPSVADLPATCTEIVECRSPRSLVWRRADSPERVEVVPDLVSVPDATRFSAAMASDAESLGLALRTTEPPERLRFDELPRATVQPGGPLAVAIGATTDGPFMVDLVKDGPHAVIGGTTGSGKSELLITWVLALAASTSPAHLSLLLFDFKGGATFAEVADLPHVTGLVTDLDEGTADRALASLRAELRQRERILHEAGVRDVRDARPGSPARLVIVVDEFAAMIESFPDLHAVFVDLAARGRSLGVHLVLCTQRPAAAVRDGVLANCDIRISLRVNNPGDSMAVVGTSDAASLPPTKPGRVVASLGGRPAVVAQIAESVAADVLATARASSGTTARRPWLDPLPARIDLGALVEPEDGFVVGLLDLPAEQSQPAAVYRPQVDGHLLVLGSAGRGSSTLLSVLAAQHPSGWSVLRVPLDLEEAWDAVSEIATRARAGAEAASDDRLLVLVDDLDLLLSRWGDDYGRAARGELVEILRSGTASGIHLVLAAHRATADVLALTDLVGSTIRLGSASKHEHVLSGADSSSYRADRRPGSGVWRGSELQVAWVEPDDDGTARRSATTPMVRLDHGLTMIVSRRPADRARWARDQGTADVILLGAPGHGTLRIDEVSDPARSTVIVGDLDAWQQQWALLTALRTTATVVVEDASAGEFRSLTRQSGLPPWITPASGRAWLMRPGQPIARVRFEAIRRPEGTAGRARSRRDAAVTSGARS